MTTLLRGFVAGEGCSAGRLISLAIALGCSTALAESGLVGLSPESRLDAGLAHSSAYYDLAQLDLASATTASAPHVGAMPPATAPVTPSKKLLAAATEVRTPVQRDVFSLSGQVLPLLVPRVQAESRAIRPIGTNRSGRAQPVGVAGFSPR